ncbi:hypothetical protein TNCV_281371 [Trichonephila clavipes]|nr:hypothetical protein TNCV_281371 [Trichonephila clavipes]
MVNVTDSGLACHEFEPSTAEDPQCREGRCALNLLKRPPVGGKIKRGILAGGYTRAFGDGPRNFEPWSNDVDDTRAGTLSSNYHTTPMGGRFSSRQI